jgi:hypothetical protein
MWPCVVSAKKAAKSSSDSINKFYRKINFLASSSPGKTQNLDVITPKAFPQ